MLAADFPASHVFGLCLFVLAAARGARFCGAALASLVRRHSGSGVLRRNCCRVTVHVCLCHIGQRRVGVLVNSAFRSIRAFAYLVLTSFLRPILFRGAHHDSLKPSLAAAWLLLGYPRSLSQKHVQKRRVMPHPSFGASPDACPLPSRAAVAIAQLWLPTDPVWLPASRSADRRAAGRASGNHAVRGLSELCRSPWHCAVIAQSGPEGSFLATPRS